MVVSGNVTLWPDTSTTTSVSDAVVSVPSTISPVDVATVTRAHRLRSSRVQQQRNLDGDGAMHEGAVLTLIDAAGATCPWTVVPPSPGASGATIALNAHVLGPLPGDGLVARAVVRARDARICWTSVTVVDSASRKVRALGTVVYRFADKNGA